MWKILIGPPALRRYEYSMATLSSDVIKQESNEQAMNEGEVRG